MTRRRYDLTGDVEHRPDDTTRHGGISTLVCVNGSRLCATDAAFIAAAARHVIAQHRQEVAA